MEVKRQESKIDTANLEYLRSLTPLQRLLQLQDAANFVLQGRKALSNAQLSKNSAPTRKSSS
jgi:hypothetical protein